MDYPVLTNRLSRPGKLGRSFLKRFMYSQMAVLTGLKIALGKEHPLIQFTVEKDPPSIYWVYRIKYSEVEGLAQKLGLPPEFSLCPIRCLDTDEPAYLLTVNAYRVSGLAKGMRAEWSIFVQNGDHTPRYMVVDARSSQRSVDPISIVTKASVVLHERDGNTVRTQLGEGEHAFRSTVTLPDDAPFVTSSEEWVSANDYIYWGNGICDRTFYNSGLANAQQRRVGKENADIQDGSFWASLVEPDPLHILILSNAIEFVVSPWENVEKTKTR